VPVIHLKNQGVFMIPGLKIDRKTEKNILNAFSKWATHFNKRFKKFGMEGLIKEYTKLIETHETQSCYHGSKGTLNTGESFQYCCGVSYEYINDLSCRDALQIIIDLLPPDESIRLNALISTLDNRLQRLQVNEEFFLNENEIKKYPKEKFWWFYGLPISVKP